MAIRILYQNEAEKSKSGDNDFFLLTNQICLYVGAALENEIYDYESDDLCLNNNLNLRTCFKI